jgi:regulator of sigma E protease
MSWLPVILGVIIIFSILVIAHEFGHFITARRNGVKVLEFGIGFPPRLWSIKKGETRYSVNLFPIGGFVRLYGEDGTETGPRSFNSKSFWQKTKIVMAGVTVNFIIAYVIFTGLLIAGVPPIIQNLPEFGPIKPITTTATSLTVFDVTKDSAANKAGIVQGDNLISIDNQKFNNSDDLRAYTKAHAGQNVNLIYTHNGNQQEKTIILGTDSSNGILGLVAEPITISRYNWWAAPFAALILMVQLIFATLAAFGSLIIGLFTRAKVSEGVAGPIGVVSLFSQIVHFGPTYILLFVASISLSLAVINALPLPALDGGRELMMILRKVGVKITPERENLIHILGFAALIGLMLIVSISDITKLF